MGSCLFDLIMEGGVLMGDHAEDLTEAVKSSACSHPFQEYSFRFLRLIQIVVDPSGYTSARGREIKVVASSARRPM